MQRVDTSIEGFNYVGINLTEKQHKDLCELNMLINANEHRQRIPVFNTMLVLKVLGLLPPEMINDVGNNDTDNNTDKDIEQSLQRKFGKLKD